MITNINPVALSCGPFDIRWYSLMYIAAAATIYLLSLWRINNDPIDRFSGMTRRRAGDLVAELLFFSFLGAVLGGRIGYAVFYEPDFFIRNPLALINPFERGNFVGLYGMSFHGGLIGAILFAYFFSRKKRLDFSGLADFLVPVAALGYFWGRIGNFLNGEILGKPSENFFSIVLPGDPSGIPRYPVQLFEAFGEGIIIFLILWPVRNRKVFRGKFLGLYLILYGVIRFFLEFFRQPENMAFWGLTTGQILCLGMVLVGTCLVNYNNLKYQT